MSPSSSVNSRSSLQTQAVCTSRQPYAPYDLNGTKELPLNLGENETHMTGFSDSDWAGNRDDRKSTGEFVLRMGEGIVSSKTQNQTSAALSSVETEYMARQVPSYRLRKPARCSSAISDSNLAL